ncbi:MAG: gamma carbonic anhydrase family protein [Gammaproteobacteria bacterium]|nr:gamma carbonic anhydrase family protein [Gammaproteobacteria bacterium]
MLRSFESIKPQFGSNCYIDDTAVVIGNVVIGNESSVWPLSVVRGDVNSIRIGDNTNVQDGSILHVSHKGVFNPEGGTLLIGNNVTVGHKVILHACQIDDSCLIGMGSIVMDNALIEHHVMLGAGSLVPGGKVLESGYLWLGNPVKKIRPLTQEEKKFLDYSALHYVNLKDKTLKTSEEIISEEI